MPQVPDAFQNLAGSIRFQAASARSVSKLLHNVIFLKLVFSAVILIGAVTISAMYNKTKPGDISTKRKLRYTSALWFGENSGMMGTMVLLWLPTVVFLACIQLIPSEAMVKAMS